MKKLFCKNECKDNGKCGIFKIVAIAGTVIAVLVGFVVLICKKFSSKKNEEDTEEFDDFELDVDETEESEDDASSDKEETEEIEESKEDDDDTSDDNVYIKDVEYSDEETEKQDEE